MVGKAGASQLIDYIVTKHHLFTVQEIERLLPLMEKARTRHGDHHPLFSEVELIDFDTISRL